MLCLIVFTVFCMCVHAHPDVCTHARTYLMHTFLCTSQFIIPLHCSVMLYIVTRTVHLSAALINCYLLSLSAKLSGVPDYQVLDARNSAVPGFVMLLM